jgi:hypothetical protein
VERQEAALLCEKSRQDNFAKTTLEPQRWERAALRRRVMPERLTRSICATRANPTQIHSTLNSLADECRGMLMHLALYLGVLALLAITWRSSMG